MTKEIKRKREKSNTTQRKKPTINITICTVIMTQNSMTKFK